MLQPNRAHLLQLRERRLAVLGSVEILKGRRQALMREFLATSKPLLRTREAIRARYTSALQRLRLVLGLEGEPFVASLAAVNQQHPGLQIVPRNILGLHYAEVSVAESPLRTPLERGYDLRGNTPHLEEMLDLFERIAAEMLETAAYEAKLKRLEVELRRLARRIRVLEERVAPRLAWEIRQVTLILGERDREEHFRLRRFKSAR